MTNSPSLEIYRSAAREHLRWCEAHGIRILGGQWSTEDPLSGLLLAAVVDPRSAPVVVSALCARDWSQLDVQDVWWPSQYVDLIANFAVGDAEYMLLVEHKQLQSPSNMPGYKNLQLGERYWQTEATLRKIDEVKAAGGATFLGGPFNASATVYPVVLDARGRSIAEAFPLYPGLPAHRHEEWASVSYCDFAARLRHAYEQTTNKALEPLLGQLFASEWG